MEKNYLGLQTTEDDRNALDKITSLVERYDIKYGIENKNEIIKLILKIDKALVDSKDEELESYFNTLLLALADIFERKILVNVNKDNVHEKFDDIERILIQFTDGYIGKTFTKSFIFSTPTIHFSLNYPNLLDARPKVGEEITIDLSISNRQEHKALHTIWFLIESLNQIEGCKVTIEDIRKGSIKATLKLLLENEQAREEAKRLLDNTKKLAEGKMTKEYEEAKKAEAEKEKIKVETEIKKKELEDSISEETDLKRKLELELLYQQIEEKRLANEKSKIENKRSELQLFQEKKKALQELLAEEFISHDQFNMMLNGLDFINKTGNVFEVGKATWKQIDQAGEGEAEEEVV
ncbi:hypothetical protein AB9P05_01760 [Roseivirga sp. BDSF3-8]|uniref:hypothetical protein n=1 Tax=Roseivirga sp. BDSF3-8 TaxID=3241598 RepID=UPI003531AAE1